MWCLSGKSDASRALRLLGGVSRNALAFRTPSFKVRLYYNPKISTVNSRVLMFTTYAMIVHKIYNIGKWRKKPAQNKTNVRYKTVAR